MISGLKKKFQPNTVQAETGLFAVHATSGICQAENKTSTDAPAVILVVDDDTLNVKLVQSMLEAQKYTIITASNGREALERVAEKDVDLILLDIMMPIMNGFECCRRLKNSEETRMIPVVMLTALDDSRSRVTGIESGADDFITKPPNRVELTARIQSLVKLKRLNSNLTSIENVLFSLVYTVEAKDPYMRGHVERVSGLSVRLGKRMGLSFREIEALRIGGALHDIGKIAIPNAILQKQARLDTDERRIIENHTIAGYRICKPLQKNLGLALSIIRSHHEKEDGSGYPDRLKRDEIPMVTKVLSVVDCYDALITDRPYRQAMAKEKAFEILEDEVSRGKFVASIVAELKNLVYELQPQARLGANDSACGHMN
jgi:putative two-component system response regulator